MAVALGLAPWASPGTAEVPFSPPRPVFSINTGIESIVVVDVDRDGDLDVAGAWFFQDRIAWYENDGDEAFTERVVSILADGAKGVAAADVDGDGDIDLISASTQDDTVAWYENDGAQQFTERLVSTTVDGANDVEAADLDGDGDIDLVAAAPADGAIFWYENDGLQNFTPHTIVNETFTQQDIELALADVNRDGWVDVLAALSFNDRVVWYDNAGTQLFDDRVVSTTGDFPSGVAANDFDGDGDVDVLSSSMIDDTVSWYENDGTEAFSGHDLPFASDGPQSVAAADLDGDGDFDLLAASFLDDSVTWYENDGLEVFTEHEIATDVNGARVALAADLDGDGDLDVVAAAGQGGEIVWFENLSPRSSARFPGAAELASLPGGAPSGIDAGDLDGDGRPDLVISEGFVEPAEDVVSWIDGDGTLGIVASGNAQFVDGVNGVELHDLDGDGDLDVLTAAAVGSDVAWHENQGGNPLSFAHHLVDPAAIGTRHATAGDLDRDGDLDIVAAAGGESTIFWYENDGSGGFSPFVVAAPSTAAVRSVDLGDIDGDGDLDIAFAATGDSHLSWLENDGAANPTFTRRDLSLPFSAPFWIRIGDVNGDGRNDLVATSVSGDTVGWARNAGGTPATFNVMTSLLNFPGAAGLELGDLDSDGDLDFAVASRDADRVQWVESSGDSCCLFLVRRPLPPVLDGALALVASDFDRDGDLDLAVANEAGSTVAWMPNVRAIFWDDFERGDRQVWSSSAP